MILKKKTQITIFTINDLGFCFVFLYEWNTFHLEISQELSFRQKKIIWLSSLSKLIVLCFESNLRHGFSICQFKLSGSLHEYIIRNLMNGLR